MRELAERTITLDSSARGDWLMIALLIVLSAVPVAAGAARLIELGSGAEFTPDNARFFAAPLPVILHIVSVTLYCVLGALQFSPGLRRRNLGWHRKAGRLLIPSGLIAAVSGLWMSRFYELPPHDGTALYVMRMIVGTAMVLALVLGYQAIRELDIARHRAWMIRAYALGIGAGTQVLTGAPWFLLFGQPDEAIRAVLMGAGWGINIVVAEWLIRRKPVLRGGGPVARPTDAIQRNRPAFAGPPGGPQDRYARLAPVNGAKEVQ